MNDVERNRWDWLALMRFFLAAVVVVFHIQRRLGLWAGTWVTQLDGRVSVIAFLLISGFSIAASLSKSPVGFYRRRLLRIYPLLIGAVVFTQGLVSGMDLHYSVQGWSNAAANIAFPPGTVGVVPSLNVPLWSLGAEMIYYILAPFIFRCPALVRWMLILISLAAYESRLVQEWDYGLPALCYAWPWLLGCEMFRSRHPAVTVVALLSVGALWFSPEVHYAPYAHALYVATVLVILCPWLPRVGGRVTDYLGAISFPLYLVHFPVVIVLADVYHVTNPLVFGGAALAVTLAFHHLVDGPGRRLLGRLV